MKGILLPFQDNPGREARLQIARDGMRALDGQLECRGARREPMLWSMATYGPLPRAQAIFGGITRTMPAASPVPLLLAH